MNLSSERVARPEACHAQVIAGISTIENRGVDYAPMYEEVEGRGTIQSICGSGRKRCFIHVFVIPGPSHDLTMTLLFRTSGDLSGLYFSDRPIRGPRLVRELVKFKVPLFSTSSFCRAGGFSVMPIAA